MGVESRFYFCKDYGFGNKKGTTDAEIVAMMDVSKMGYEPEAMKFFELFDKETPFNLYLSTTDEEGNEVMAPVIEDPYGDRLKYGDYEELIPQLKKVIQEDKTLRGNTYWRYKPLMAMLKEFSKADEKIYCVLYQY